MLGLCFLLLSAVVVVMGVEEKNIEGGPNPFDWVGLHPQQLLQAMVRPFSSVIDAQARAPAFRLLRCWIFWSKGGQKINSSQPKDGIKGGRAVSSWRPCHLCHQGVEGEGVAASLPQVDTSPVLATVVP